MIPETKQVATRLAKALDRNIRMRIVSRELRAIQEGKKDFNKWQSYFRGQLAKMKINATI